MENTQHRNSSLSNSSIITTLPLIEEKIEGDIKPKVFSMEPQCVEEIMETQLVESEKVIYQ